MGAGAFYPGRLVLDEAGHGSFVDYLCERFGQPVTVAISVGPARANLKPVLAVFGETGDPLAFVKVGFPDAARTHVIREIRSLEVVAGRTFTRLDVPRLLFVDTWCGHPVLVTRPLVTPANRVPRAGARIPFSAMAELTNAFATPTVPLAEVPGWRRLRDQAQHGPTSEEFGVLVDQLHERHGDQLVRPSAWHGDWTSWNMYWGRDRITLWDWERFEREVPSGLDSFHYTVCSYRQIRGSGTENIELALQWVQQSRPLCTLDSQLTGQLYLAFIAGRHLQATGEFAPLAGTTASVMLGALAASMTTQSAT